MDHSATQLLEGAASVANTHRGGGKEHSCFNPSQKQGEEDKMKALTALLVVGMFATTVAMADDVDDVKAALQRYGTALDTGDANAWIQLHAAGNTRFSPGGGLLETFGSLEQQRKDRQGAFDAGLKLNVQSRHVEVSLYGNTAVSTRYGVGTVTQPNGTVVQLNNRITTVLIKQGGQWKIVHQHLSPVRLPQ